MNKNETYICPLCGRTISKMDMCTDCEMAFENRRPVASMTVSERLAELRGWFGPISIPFALIHQRIAELMGRDVWTHELAYPDSLYSELTSGEAISFEEVVAKLPQDKPIFIAKVPPDEARRNQP